MDPATVFAPDDPAWTLHENIPEDLPESERLQMLIEEICELEMKRERERLVEELGPRRAPRLPSRSRTPSASSSSRWRR